MEWQRYYALEPFGQAQADLMRGTIAATVANGLLRGKGEAAYKPEDFIPRFEPAQKVSANNHLAAIMAATMGAGGKIIYKREGEL